MSALYLTITQRRVLHLAGGLMFYCFALATIIHAQYPMGTWETAGHLILLLTNMCLAIITALSAPEHPATRTEQPTQPHEHHPRHTMPVFVDLRPKGKAL